MILARLKELKALIKSLNESRQKNGFGSIVLQANEYDKGKWSLILIPKEKKLFFSFEVSKIMTFCLLADISVHISYLNDAPYLGLQ